MFAFLKSLWARIFGGDNRWEIGPVIQDHNYSINEPLHTTGSFTIGPNIEPHYVTRPGSLKGRSKMYLKFNVTGPLRGAGSESAATVSLYFQRSGDDWSTDGMRWWASFATVTVDHAGDYEITAPLNGKWSSVMIQTAETNPKDFADARAHASRVGFTFGNNVGLGHGAFALEPMKFTIVDFTIQ